MSVFHYKGQGRDVFSLKALKIELFSQKNYSKRFIPLYKFFFFKF